jgi:hypothetical protein
MIAWARPPLVRPPTPTTLRNHKPAHREFVSPPGWVGVVNESERLPVPGYSCITVPRVTITCMSVARAQTLYHGHPNQGSLSSYSTGTTPVYPCPLHHNPLFHPLSHCDWPRGDQVWSRERAGVYNQIVHGGVCRAVDALTRRRQRSWLAGRCFRRCYCCCFASALCDASRCPCPASDRARSRSATRRSSTT